MMRIIEYMNTYVYERNNIKMKKKNEVKNFRIAN